jgi:hypothetical protein
VYGLLERSLAQIPSDFFKKLWHIDLVALASKLNQVAGEHGAGEEIPAQSLLRSQNQVAIHFSVYYGRPWMDRRDQFTALAWRS